LGTSLLSIGVVDLAVLALSLLIVFVIGLRASAQVKSLDAYLLGDRDLPWWAILGSIVATETSTATVLSVPAVAFGETGFRYLQLAFGYMTGRLIVAYLLLPLYFRGELSTAYEVLQQRFGLRTRQAASMLFLLTRNLGDGLRLFLAAIVLQVLANWDFVTSVVVMGVITIAYTVLGGLRSVVWNDCIQLVIYLAGGVASVFIVASLTNGGWETIFTFAQQHDKFTVLSFSTSLSERFTFWTGMVGGSVLTLGTHGTDHMMVQRYLSARSQSDAKLAVVLSGVVVFLQFALFLLIGVELAAFYSQHPEVTFETADQVFATFLVDEFPRGLGLIGLMLSAILAAAMSTLSSSLNASASALINDFYLAGRSTASPAHSGSQMLLITRVLTVMFGVIQMGIAVLARQFDQTVVESALTIAGFSAGLLLGVFLLGLLPWRVPEYAALSGGAAGLAVLLIVQFVLPNWGWKLAWPWYATVGATVTFVVGCIGGLPSRLLAASPAREQNESQEPNE
jgi:solute:Na+ symporter, SSS family